MTYVVLDTMMFLHFQSPENVNWCDMLEVKPLTILVPRSVVRELDRQKTQHASAKVRDRARRALIRVEAWAHGGTSLRDGVLAEVDFTDPTDFFEQNGLSRDWQDDNLLATILAIRSGEATKEITLVSDDTGIRIKARALGIRTFAPPETIRLSSEVDPVEEENKRLKARIAELAAVPRPNLLVCFTDDEKFVRFPISKRLEDKTSKFEKELEQLRQKYKPYSSARVPSILQFSRTSDKEIRRYDESLEPYFQAYAEYQRAMFEYEQREQLIFEVKPMLRNRGTAPAEDVDVHLHVPDGFRVIDADERPRPPMKPATPIPPRTTFEMIASMSGLNSDRLMRGVINTPQLDFGPSESTGPHIEEVDSYEVSYSVRNLKHGYSFRLAPIVVIFDTVEDVGSFRIHYRCNAANMPIDAEGDIHVAFDDRAA